MVTSRTSSFLSNNQWYGHVYKYYFKQLHLGGEVTDDREAQRRDFSLTNSLRNVMQSQPKEPKMNLWSLFIDEKQKTVLIQKQMLIV